MTINWQAKDSKGNNINCSMTVEVNSKGIKRVTAEPKFGDLIFKDLESEETKKKILELVEQNTYLKEQSAKLKKHNTRITEEGDEELNKLTKEKQDLEKEVTRLKDELKRKEKELAEKDQDIKQLERKVSTLEQSQKNKNARITNLINQLKDKKSEVQSTNRTNEELQKKLEQSEAKLSALERKNANLENDLKRILAEGSKDNHERQLAEQLTEAKEKNNTLTKELKQLSQEFNELKKRNENLEREIWQLESGKSLADEMSEINTNEEIDKLKQQFKAKEGMLQEELKSVKEALEKLQDILQQEKDLAAISTQTEVEYKSRGIEASDHETTVPKTQDQGTNAGVNVSSSTDQKKTKEMEVQTDLQMKDSYDLYDIKNKHIKTIFKDVSVAPAKVPEKSTPSKG